MFEELLEYIEIVVKYGFSCIFICLIFVNDEVEFVKLEIICKCVKELGFDVIVDVDFIVFELLNIIYKELDCFKELGLVGLCLDLGFFGFEEVVMFFDDMDLKIELNISNGICYVENILFY